MNIKYKLSCIAASLLLAACTSENTLETPTPPDEGTASANNTREVLVLLKNKLKAVSYTHLTLPTIYSV